MDREGFILHFSELHEILGEDVGSTQSSNQRRQAKHISYWCLRWQADVDCVAKREVFFLILVRSKSNSYLNFGFLQLFFICLSPVSHVEHANFLQRFIVSLVLGEDQYSDHNPTPLVAEEKISFGINAICSSLTTVQDIKSSYNEVDGRLIAKEVTNFPHLS